MQKNNNGDKNWLSMGMLATKNNPNDIKIKISEISLANEDEIKEV